MFHIGKTYKGVFNELVELIIFGVTTVFIIKETN